MYSSALPEWLKFQEPCQGREIKYWRLSEDVGGWRDFSAVIPLRDGSLLQDSYWKGPALALIWPCLPHGMKNLHGSGDQVWLSHSIPLVLKPHGYGTLMFWGASGSQHCSYTYFLSSRIVSWSFKTKVLPFVSGCMVEIISKFVSFVQFSFWLESWELRIFEGEEETKLSLYFRWMLEKTKPGLLQ